VDRHLRGQFPVVALGGGDDRLYESDLFGQFDLGESALSAEARNPFCL
jgi:hypothetical protein